MLIPALVVTLVSVITVLGLFRLVVQGLCVFQTETASTVVLRVVAPLSVFESRQSALSAMDGMACCKYRRQAYFCKYFDFGLIKVPYTYAHIYKLNYLLRKKELRCCQKISDQI
jgi:hypothetical protein